MRTVIPPTEREQLKARIAYLEARLVHLAEKRSAWALVRQAWALEQIGCELYDRFGLKPEQIDFIAERADDLRRRAREGGRP